MLGGGASAIFGALTTMGIPKNSVVLYETALKADQFLVSVHCARDAVPRTAQLLTQAGGREVQSHALDLPSTA